MNSSRSPFWLSFWLAVVLIVSKAIYCGLPGGWSAAELWSKASEVMIVSGSDVLFAMSVGMGGKGLLLLSSRWPRWHRMVWGGLVAFCAVSVFYSVASMRIYEILRLPLTYPLLRFGADMSAMRSSVGAFLSFGIVAALVGFPVLYHCVVMLCDRFVKLGPGWRAHAVRWSCVALGLTWFAEAQHKQVVGEWSESRDDHRIAQNAHFVLMSSLVSEWFGAKAVLLKETFPVAYLADFETVREQAGAGRPTSGITRGPKNVIVVICESVGTQQLSLYGSPLKTWPCMEAEAAHSMVFDHYYSHLTNTANSLYSLTLSIYPPLTWRQYTEERPNAAGVTTAQVLKEHGYRTAFLTAGYNDWAGMGRFLQHRGYDVIRDARDAVKEGEPEMTSWGVEDRWLVDDIFKFIDRTPEQAGWTQPFYVFSWTQGTHHPYEPGPKWEDKDFLNGNETYGDMTWELGRYLNALFELDKQLGRLMDGLRARNLADDTMVVITGDHGEAFGFPHGNSVGHSGKVYQEDVNVPLVIWSRSLFKGGERSHAFGAHVDLSATILDLLDIGTPDSWQGRSLLSPSHSARCYFYGVMDDYLLGVREGQYKYVFNATLGQQALYDLANDHQEQTNIAPQHPDVCRSLRQRLAAWVQYGQRQ